MANPNPYYRRRFTYECARLEFRYFLESAPTIIQKELSTIPRAQFLRSVHGFNVRSFDNFSLQIWFGARPTGREVAISHESPSRNVSEEGAKLVYSLGPRGHTAVIFYPAESAVMKAQESFVIRAFGEMTSYQLCHRIKRDLKDLVAYMHVTGLDGAPTPGEWVRVQWFKLVCRVQTGGSQQIRTWEYFFQGVGFITRAGLIALMRPWGIAVLLIALALFGRQYLVDFLMKGASLR